MNLNAYQAIYLGLLIFLLLAGLAALIHQSIGG
jgi:hypothetical protein